MAGVVQEHDVSADMSPVSINRLGSESNHGHQANGWRHC